MELKVWVDGIQRVVCGASYNTTCQDVVVALAHAMGRTGRFTLVEKWRDSERPLTPGECPLQALHKWGEYAAEVRFYLVQAETDKAKQQQQTKSRQKMSIEKLDKFTHNFTPPQSAHNLGVLGPESIKRSSTFSGAHNLNYAGFPSASLSSSMSSTFSHNNRNQQPHNHPSASAKLRRTALGPLPNGEIVSASSSNSSPRSSSRSSPRDASPASRGSASSSSHATSSSHRPSTFRGDARELHPANMPLAASLYSNQDRELPALKYSTHQPQSVPHQPSYSTSSQRSYPAPSRSSSSQNYQPSSYQTSESVTSTPHPSSQHPMATSSSSSSQQAYSQHNHPHPVHAQPVPAPRHQRTLSPSVEYENLPPHPRDRHIPPSRRERSGERSSQRNTPVSSQARGEDSSKMFYHGEDRTGASIGDSSSYFYQHGGAGGGGGGGGRGGTQSYQTNVNDGRRDHFQDQRGRMAHSQSDYPSSDRNTQGRSRSNDRHLSEPSNMSESSNRQQNRFVPQPQISKGLPSRSFASTESARNDGNVRQSGDHLSKSLPESSLNSLHQSGEAAGKLSFVESALVRQQRSSLESNIKAGGGAGGMSSFASAVAHIKQHSGGDSHLKIPKSETHVRQHSSDSSRTDESFQGGFGRNVSPRGLSSSNQNLMSSLNHPHEQYKPQQPPLSPSNRPASNLTSISPFRQNSAFTQVSPRTSRQGSSSSPSAAIAYNLDHHNFDNYGVGLGDGMGPSQHRTQTNELSHSRQASLEVEEYDLDQNFPDVTHRADAGGISGAGVKMQMQRGGGMPLEYHLDDGGVIRAQDETEYLQLVRLVRMQEEKLKMQEAQITDWNMEISTLEEKESKDVSELEVITQEVTQLEEKEAKVKIELEDLDGVEWINVLDGERKREADINLQMKNLQEKFDVLENELRQLKEQEEKQTREVKEEREKIERENKKNEELDRKISFEMKELGEKLTSVDKQVKEKEKHLVDLEKMIEKADTDLKEQEKKVDDIEKELKDENMKDFQAHPVAKEPAPSSVPSPAPVVSPASLTVMSGSDSGEAILKILEGRLSPRSPPTSPAADGDSNVGGITSAQQTYKSAMAAKSPNGVWV